MELNRVVNRRLEKRYNENDLFVSHESLSQICH